MRSTPQQTKPIKFTTWTWIACQNFLPCPLSAFPSGTLATFSSNSICWHLFKSDLRSICVCVRAYDYVGACDCEIISKTDVTNFQLFVYVRACLFTLSSQPLVLANQVCFSTTFLPQCFNQTTDFLSLHSLSCSYL